MKKLVCMTAIVAGFAVVIMGAAFATSASMVTSTSLAQGDAKAIDVMVKTGDWKLKLDTNGPSTLATSEIRVAPGGHFGWHSHPGPSLVIVKSGTSTFYRADDPTCTGQEHPTGSAYVDPGGVVHTARNEGSVELVLIVIRILPPGATARI